MGSECGTRAAWVVAGLVVLTLVALVVHLLTVPAPVPIAAAPTPSTSSRPVSVPSPRPSASAGLREAVGDFLTVWSTVDPAERTEGLARTATNSLAEQLQLTASDEVPPACTFAGALEVADVTPTSVLVTVPTSCEGALWLGLTRDDTAPRGWRVSAIGKERSWIQ